MNHFRVVPILESTPILLLIGVVLEFENVHVHNFIIMKFALRYLSVFNFMYRISLNTSPGVYFFPKVLN